MNTRNIRVTLDNPRILKKRQGIGRECHDFNEANFLFNLSSAFANDRLSEYLQELIGRVRGATFDVETGGVFEDLLEQSFRAAGQRQTQNFIRCVLEFFGRRAKLQAEVLYEPFQLVFALNALERKFAKTPEARDAKRNHRALKQAVDGLLDAMGEFLFDPYPSWFLEFVILLGFEFDLNRKICGDNRDRIFDFSISLQYAYKFITISAQENPTSIDFANEVLGTEEQCFERFCAKKYLESVPCDKPECDGAYRYKLSGRRALVCDQQGCRDQFYPCTGTFFEARKGDLSDWFLGLLFLQRSTWIGETDRWQKKQVRETLGRKRFDEIMTSLAKQQVSAYNKLHKPDMVRMPTTGLIVEQSIDGNSIGVSSFSANAEFKSTIKKPTIIGFVAKK